MRPASDSREGSLLQGMILLSLLLHGIVFAAFFVSPPSFSSPKLTFGPVHTVSLVSAPAYVPVQRRDAAAELAKQLKAEQRPETVLKKVPQTDNVIPIRPMEVQKKQETSIEKAIEEMHRKTAVQDVPQPSLAKASGEKTASSPPLAAAAPEGPGRGDAELNDRSQAYYALVWSRIKGNWTYPRDILPRDSLETVILVTILKSGAVSALSYEKRSGDNYFDQSAMRAIQKANPFPPLPAGIGENSLDMGIRFHPSGLIR